MDISDGSLGPSLRVQKSENIKTLAISEVGLSGPLECSSPSRLAVRPEILLSASIPKSALLRIGLRVTRHPRMGAAQQP